MALIIHRMGAEDWRRARDIRLRALGDTPDAFGSVLADELAFPDAKWRERVARTDSVTFLAELDGNDAGIAVGAPRDAGGAGLFSMWVAPEARGRGVGDALIGAVVEWARGRGFDQLVLNVSDHNAPAIALYERHGFARTGNVGTLPPPRTHVAEHERALTLR